MKIVLISLIIICIIFIITFIMCACRLASIIDEEKESLDFNNIK